MTPLLSSIISLILGSILVINGTLVRTDDVINQAKASVNGANIHQLATVIELYYSNHESYPNVSGGVALIETLESEGYIRNRPLDPKVFLYESKNNGQDFLLKLAE